jgi:carbon starvation protein
VIIKMGKAKYSFLTLIPLTWLTIVNMTAGYQKIFSADPKLGFLAHASWIQDFLDKGGLPPGVANATNAGRMIFNDRLDAGIAAFFLIAVIVILTASMKEWIAVISGKKAPVSTEVPFAPRSAFAQTPTH